jgi:hypothetical protein
MADIEECRRWLYRPAYDVGDPITITRRRPWWKFWLPREYREVTTVRRVWFDRDRDITRVETD